MNKETFLTLDISKISIVYIGKNHHCRCGCGGTYISTSFMKNPRSEVDDKLVEQRLKRAKKLVLQGAKTVYSSNNINIETGVNLALTFYTDELK